MTITNQSLEEVQETWTVWDRAVETHRTRGCRFSAGGHRHTLLAASRAGLEEGAACPPNNTIEHLDCWRKLAQVHHALHRNWGWMSGMSSLGTSTQGHRAHGEQHQGNRSATWTGLRWSPCCAEAKPRSAWHRIGQGYGISCGGGQMSSLPEVRRLWPNRGTRQHSCWHFQLISPLRAQGDSWRGFRHPEDKLQTWEKHRQKGKWNRPIPHQTQYWACWQHGREDGVPSGEIGICLSLFPFFFFPVFFSLFPFLTQKHTHPKSYFSDPFSLIHTCKLFCSLSLSSPLQTLPHSPSPTP